MRAVEKFLVPDWSVPPLVLSGLGVIFYIGRTIATSDLYLGFMNWNLFLAWLPTLFSWWLVGTLKRHRWLSRRALILTFLWLVFLPNSFYIITDFIHLETGMGMRTVYDVVMLMSYSLSGVLLGCTSIALVHDELKKRLKLRQVIGVLAAVITASSYAIYLGRVLRYNSWDVLLNPASIFLDAVERLLNPAEYVTTFAFLLIFFLFISGVYVTYYSLHTRLQSHR